MYTNETLVNIRAKVQLDSLIHLKIIYLKLQQNRVIFFFNINIKFKLFIINSFLFLFYTYMIQFINISLFRNYVLHIILLYIQAGIHSRYSYI